MGRGQLLAAFCLVLGLIASALAQMTGEWGSEPVPDPRVPAEFSSPFSEIESFAGIGALETGYDLIVGTREIGLLSSGPYDIRPEWEKEIDVPWVGSGVEFHWDSYETYLTETRYHFVASSDPNMLGEIGTITALRQATGDVRSTEAFTTSSIEATFDYEALMTGRDRRLYAASARSPRIDVYNAATRTDPRFEKYLDFSDLIGSENGFSSAVLYDEGGNVLHFGTKRAPAGVATAITHPEGPKVANFIPFDADATDVVGMRYSNHRDELYALVASPPRLYYIKGDLPNANGEVLGHLDLSFARGVPVAMTLDRNDIVPQAYALFCGDEGTEILKFEFGEIGTPPIYIGSFQSNHIRVNTMLHDRVWEYLVFTGVNPVANRREVLRVFGGRRGKPPVLVDPSLDTWTFPAKYTDHICNYSYFHFYSAWPTFPLSNGTSPTTLFTLGFYPRWNAHERLAATRVTGEFRTPRARVTSLNFYSHESGSQVRLALYDATPTSVPRPRNLLWASAPIPTIDEGWLSVPVDNIPGSILNSGQTSYLAFQTDRNRPIASVARRVEGYGARTDKGPTFDSFPEQWPVWTDSNEVFSFYYTYEEEIRLESFTANPLPSPEADDYLSTRSLPIVYTGLGDPNVLEVSETSSNGPFLQVPMLSGQAVYTLAQEGREYRRLWLRARNSFTASEVVPIWIALRADFQAPPPPPAPEPLEEFTVDSRIAFRVYTSDDPPGGSGWLHTVVEVRDVADGTLLHQQVIENETVITVPVAPGIRAHARARSFDKAMNAGQWSDWSATARRNAPPRILSLAINPESPRSFDDIAALVLGEDPDGDDFAYKLAWSLNGEVISTSSTLASVYTTRDQEWMLSAMPVDQWGATGETTTISFAIANARPTQPDILIQPRRPAPGVELSVEMISPAIDPDDDPILYDYRWWHSPSIDNPFLERLDLRGSTTVPGHMVAEGDLWEVHLYAEESTDPLLPDSQFFASDRVYVGVNGLPQLAVGQPFGKAIATRGNTTEVKLSLYWDFIEPDGEPCSVDLHWTDLRDFERVPIATGLPAEQRRYVGRIDVPTIRPIHILVTITDAKGAQVRQLTPPIRPGDVGTLLMAY